MMLENFSENFVNLKTKDKATLFVVEDKTQLSLSDLSRLEEIFNQPDCHKMFEPKFINKHFEQENIINFINWAKKNDNYYLFLVRNKRMEIVGGIDLQIKSYKKASIGFWQDERVPGYIISGLSFLLPIVDNLSFSILDSYTELSNTKAMKVLSRAGFIEKGIVEGKTKGKLVRFIRP